MLKAATKDKAFHDYLLVNYFDKEFGEQHLFEQAKQDLEAIMQKRHKGFTEDEKLANMLAVCSKRIIAFSAICTNKQWEADLILLVLAVPFSKPRS